MGRAVLSLGFALLASGWWVGAIQAEPPKDGPTEKLVRELALGERVKFVSGISDADLGDLLASAEIAAVPSRYEGFSLPAVEHMASGSPLVASRAGALPEVVGDAAVLVEPGDVEDLHGRKGQNFDDSGRVWRRTRGLWRHRQKMPR